MEDLNNTVVDQIEEGDKVVTRAISRGTHTGPWGELPPSGNRLTVEWILISRFQGDKIVEEWEVVDSLSMMRQMGAVA